jgi:hypothetical protein
MTNLVCAMAAVILTQVAGQGGREIPSFKEWKQLNAPASEIALSLEIVSPARRGKKMKALLGVRNTSDRRLLLAFPESLWPISVSFYPRSDPDRIESIPSLTSHGVLPGKNVCFQPSEVFAIGPGQQLVRGIEFEVSEDVKGLADVEVEVAGVVVPNDMACTAARLLRGRAKAQATIK